MLQKNYAYRVTWSEDDREYVGLCVEFSRLRWLDKTTEAIAEVAAKQIIVILSLYLADFIG
jgi:hypothetical protein